MQPYNLSLFLIPSPPLNLRLTQKIPLVSLLSTVLRFAWDEFSSSFAFCYILSYFCAPTSPSKSKTALLLIENHIHISDTLYRCIT